MNRCLFFILVAIAVISSSLICNRAVVAAEAPSANQSAGLNTLTAAEKAAGWKLLFDGKTTAGWRIYRKPDVSEGWKVVDGALTATGWRDIITTGQYGAFELMLDYKISKGANSGIMFHVTEDAEHPYETGPEIQIYDHPGGPGIQKTGFLYNLYGSEVDSTKPAGEWNQMRLLITPEKCETYINGVKYHEYVIGSDDWNKRLSNSKFKDFPRFAKADRGHICLQAHGGELAFRNIKIRPIGEK